MKVEPINRKVHDILISKGFMWKPKTHMDMYEKDGTIVFIYMNNYAFMMINGRVATGKELEDATHISI